VILRFLAYKNPVNVESSLKTTGKWNQWAEYGVKFLDKGPFASGNFGEVWKATYDEKTVAVKILKDASQSQNETVIEMTVLR
jgi:hypothetical protein